MARFSHRDTRLSRQRESSVFSQIVMPISALIGVAGVLAMLAVYADHLLNDRWEAGAFGIAAAAAALPVLLFLYRWLRGHFNEKLRDP